MASLAELDFTKFFSDKVYYTNLEIAARKQPMHMTMRLNWVHMMIERVESAKVVLKSDGDLQPKAKEALDEYEVLEVTSAEGGTEKKLYIKPSPGVLWEVIPLTKSFPIVAKAHMLTNHGKIDDMKEWLANANIFVAPFCLPTIIKVCRNCPNEQVLTPADKTVKKLASESAESTTMQAKESYIMQFQKFVNVSEQGNQQRIDPEVRNKLYTNTGQVTLIDMPENISLFYLKTLLIYEDMYTGFLLLRPINSSSIIESITAELMHIFTDMTPPKLLIVQTSMTSLFNEVIERLNKIFRSDIKIGTRVVAPDVVIKVENALKDWLQKKELGSKWYIGCYIVQWVLNNTKGKDGKTSFEKMFGRSFDESTSLSRDESMVNSIDDLQMNSSKS